MSYRITYGQTKQRKWQNILWAIPILAALTLFAVRDGWYEAFARYVGAAIRDH